MSLCAPASIFDVCSRTLTGSTDRIRPLHRVRYLSERPLSFFAPCIVADVFAQPHHYRRHRGFVIVYSKRPPSYAGKKIPETFFGQGGSGEAMLRDWTNATRSKAVFIVICADSPENRPPSDHVLNLIGMTLSEEASMKNKKREKGNTSFFPRMCDNTPSTVDPLQSV